MYKESCAASPIVGEDIRNLPPGFVNTGTLLDRGSIRVDSARRSGSDIVVKIHEYRGHSFQLQYRDDLSAGTWQNTGASIAGADALITFTHSNRATATQRFYRVVVN